MTETEKMWAILDLIREGLKAVENNDKLYEEFSNGMKQLVSSVVQPSKAGVVVAAESRNSESKNDCEQLINKIAKNSPQKLVVVVNKCNGNQTISSLVQATSKEKEERIDQLYDIDNNDNNERVHALVTPTGACGPFYSDGGKSESNLKVEAPPLDPTTYDHHQQLHVIDHDQPTPIVSNCTMEHDHSTTMTSNCTKKSC